MLNSINLDDKSYEDLMAEALSKIPLYSDEWTNFNRSDPGVTILQNLSAFTLLQRGSINQVTDEVLRALLGLAGYRTQENRAATLLVKSPGGEPLPPQYQLRLGNLCFETEEETPLSGWEVEAMYASRGEAFQDITMLLETEAGTAAVFGAEPQAGNALYLILSGRPETERPLLLWAQVSGRIPRNPFPETGGPSFARTRWQYYTAEGWADALAQDETHTFLTSGKISLLLNAGEPAVFEGAPVRGYALRCLLEECGYDQPPRLELLEANLFPVRQWETRAWTYPAAGGGQVEIRSPLAELGNLYVYCREVPGGPYRLYAPFTGVTQTGRLYLREDFPGGVRLTFHRARFGFGPCQEEDAVLVSCFDNEMIHHRDLGPVYGYEDQEIPLDLVENVLPDRFLLLMESPDGEGEAGFYPVRPGTEGEGGLRYRLDPTAGKLYIVHPGFGAGSRLYLANCCTTAGDGGNIRPGSVLTHPEPPFSSAAPRSFRGVSSGFGGRRYETAEQLRQRFAAGVRTPAAAVLPSDYEALVLCTPGLCLHKAHAAAFPEENLIRLTAKPYSSASLPRLSPFYLEEIHKWLEPRRMLTTRVELVQPRYVPVDVWAALQVKSYYDNAAEAVEALLREALDYVNGPQPFGSRIRFSALYQQLMELPCVEAVIDFKLIPREWNGVTPDAPDLVLGPYSLCCPGEFHIQLQTFSQNQGGSR